VAGEEGVTSSSVLTWLRKVFPEHHDHTYKSHELANIEQVRLKSLSFRLSEDAKSLRFELLQAVALNTLLARLPADWLSAPTRMYPILWQKAYAEEAAASGAAPASAALASTSSSTAPASAALASTSSSAAQASTSSSAPAPPWRRASVAAASSAVPAASAPLAVLPEDEAADEAAVEEADEAAHEAAAEAAHEAAAEEAHEAAHQAAAKAPDAVPDEAADEAAARPDGTASRGSHGPPPPSQHSSSRVHVLADSPAPSGLHTPAAHLASRASVDTSLVPEEFQITLNKREANVQLQALTTLHRTLQEQNELLLQQQNSLRFLQSRAYFDAARSSIVFRVVAGSQHTFKLELTRVVPHLDKPPEDRITLTKISTQPPPWSSKADNPIAYDVYDQDVADTLKSRERSTLVIQPPRPLDAEYYGVSDGRQSFCKKLYHVPPPAATGTLWEQTSLSRSSTATSRKICSRVGPRVTTRRRRNSSS